MTTTTPTPAAGFIASTTPPAPRTAFTARQRLLCALRGQPADRVPAWLMRQAGRYLPEYQAVRARHDFLTMCKTPEAACEVSLQPLAAVGSEAVIIFNDIMLPLEHAGAHVEFDEGGPHVLNPVRTPADLAALGSRPVAPDEPVARTIALARQRAGEDVPILGFIGAPWTLACYWVEGRMSRHFGAVGPLRFRDPALLLALLERITPVVTDYLKIQIAAGADAVQIFDTWGSILSREEYARFSAPFITSIVAALRADPATAATPVVLYVNGCAPYLEQLAALGADCLSVDWRLDLATARARLDAATPAGARPLALQGNLDPLALHAGPQAAARAVREQFAAFPPRPGHVFNLGHGILPGTPVDSVRAILAEVRAHGAY